MLTGKKPWWQQATALVTVSTGGIITGLNFVPGTAATATSPASVPLHLLALEQGAQPVTHGSPGAAADEQLRTAIVRMAEYYLRLAQSRTPAQVESLIWDSVSTNGADHGPTCAAFASLTLELAAQAIGQQSWVSGGKSYPWPLPHWADVRVDTNPDSPDITSVVADAESHGRWHALGDGYVPRPGDWVLFNQHMEVITGYSDGVLHTIGASSLPNLTVNAHTFGGSLADDGVDGFVNNGQLTAAGQASSTAPSSSPAAKPGKPPTTPKPGPTAKPRSSGKPGSRGKPRSARVKQPAQAAVPGVLAPTASASAGAAAIPGTATTTQAPASKAPKAPPTAAPSAKPTATPSAKPTSKPSSSASSSGRQYATPATSVQQEFINLVAPGAIAAQRRYGVPAAVTIAQAIDESGWGGSGLSAQYHNLFGIKGTGPAGSVTLPTSEYYNSQWVTIDAQFRVYHNDAESIADHAELLATSGYYTRAMADRRYPDAFANDLTGIYATDPNYGSNLIALMKLYNLYRFDVTSSPSSPSATATPTIAPSHPASPTSAPTAKPTKPVAAPSASPTQAGARPAATPPSRPSGQARVPGVTVPALVPTPAGRAGTASTAGPTARVPGVMSPATTTSLIRPTTSTRAQASPNAQGQANARVPGVVSRRAAVTSTVRYEAELPQAVTTALFVSAKAPLARSEHLYRDVAAQSGIHWQLLAAVDWMQCKAEPRRSPVHGEKLGSANPDGSSYRTKSQALAQCANELVQLSAAVYGVDLTARRPLSVRSLADAFAAFRWGGLLRRDGVSAMEFPYSVAGLTPAHLKMHWPPVDALDAPDRPGARFREPFGAVPVVLSLNYPAIV